MTKKLRNTKGQFVKGHGKVAKKRHHKRRNPALLAPAAGRVAGTVASKSGLARAARLILVR